MSRIYKKKKNSIHAAASLMASLCILTGLIDPKSPYVGFYLSFLKLTCSSSSPTFNNFHIKNSPLFYILYFPSDKAEVATRLQKKESIRLKLYMKSQGSKRSLPILTKLRLLLENRTETLQRFVIWT